jgi:N-acetylmuramoyl-L-alanine amidase
MISIHQNSFPSPSAKGAQVFYYRNSEEGERLAQCIQKAIVEKADNENTRQAKENENYYLLKNTSVPSVIVECGFLSNRAEEAKLNSNEYQQMMAWAIYSGITEYFSADKQ